MSNWENENLTSEQVSYAARDAIVGRELFYHLLKKSEPTRKEIALFCKKARDIIHVKFIFFEFPSILQLFLYKITRLLCLVHLTRKTSLTQQISGIGVASNSVILPLPLRFLEHWRTKRARFCIAFLSI